MSDDPTLGSPLRDRLAMALAGRYDRLREIGSGGMAVVYFAHDVRHDRDVAIKVLRDDVARAIGPDRFLHEIQFVAKLAHPHILPLYDSGLADGLMYFVMPNVEDRSLRDRLHDVAECKGVLLLCHAGVEHDLQQEIAELFPEIVEVAAGDGIHHLIGFLDRVRGNRRKFLLEVPRAAGHRRAQRRHDLKKA